MTLARLAGAVVVVGLWFLVAPETAHAWTPGTHIYLGESVLANLPILPAAIADLLRAYPFDFLYGNIAADSSIALTTVVLMWSRSSKVLSSSMRPITERSVVWASCVIAWM